MDLILCKICTFSEIKVAISDKDVAYYVIGSFNFVKHLLSSFYRHMNKNVANHQNKNGEKIEDSNSPKVNCNKEETTKSKQLLNLSLTACNKWHFLQNGPYHPRSN